MNQEKHKNPKTTIALNELKERFDSEKFISNVCLSFRHDFGLLTYPERQKLRHECKEWMRAISNNFEHFKP